MLGLLTAVLALPLAETTANAATPTPEPPDSGQEMSAPGQWLHIIKSPDRIYVPRGGRAQFTIAVLNTSNTFALRDIAITDQYVPNCSLTIGALAPGGEYSYPCVQQNVNAPYTNLAEVTGVNVTNGKRDSASDTAVVEIVELSIDVTAVPAVLPEPGGPVTFSLLIRNSGSAAAELASLSSPQFGDLLSPLNPLLQDNTCKDLPAQSTLAPGDTPLTCTFTAVVQGQPGPFEAIIETTAIVGGTFSFQNTGSETIQLTNTPTELQATLTTATDRAALGSTLTFNVNLLNNSAADSITIANMSDSELGDVSSSGSCVLPQILLPGAGYECAYTQIVQGEIDSIVTYDFTASGENDDIPPQAVSAQASKSILVFQPLAFMPFTSIALNDSCERARFLNTGQEYSFTPAIRDAWYSFVVRQTATIDIKMTRYVPKTGQMIVYSEVGPDCRKSKIEGNDGGFTETKQVILPQAPPKRYFIRIYTDGVLNDEIPYTISIELR